MRRLKGDKKYNLVQKKQLQSKQNNADRKQITNCGKNDAVLKSQLIALQAALEAANRQLFAERELERKKRLADIGTLAATVAHELRNPLAAINMAVYNIKRKSNNPLLDENFECINLKIAESEKIISNILYYSKLRPPEFEAVLIYDVLKECIENAQGQLKRVKKIDLRGIKLIEKQVIAADKSQLKEVFSNLLNNAYDAIDNQNGIIAVKAKVKDNTVTVSVRDNGKGIDLKDLEHVYDPFFTTKAKGTGLGLAVCLQIIRFHNGTINIDSKRGKGTDVRVSLPVSQDK